MNENKEAVTKEEMKETRSVWAEIYDWIDTAVITVVCVLLLFTFVFKQVQVDGTSMCDTLQNNERIIMSDVFYTPKYGDIVVISDEVYGDIPLIKRVIATEGQWVDIADGVVYVGDSKEDMTPKGNEFTKQSTEAVVSALSGYHQYPLQVPEGTVFVLGDNRSVSLDSRTQAVGFVDTDQILGKALYRVFPMDKMGSIY